ncbi:MAG: beta-L-arabinofuranosidase domain-containing protein [Bacteroidota bacterium]
MKKYISILFFMCVVNSCSENKSSQGVDFLSKIDQNQIEIINDSDQLTFFDSVENPIKPQYTAFPTGSTQPKGWLFEFMKKDLDHGLVGALPKLYPGIKKDDLYGTMRRGGLEDVPEMGDLVLTGEAWEKSIMWWNAETIGNWWDGFVRHAFLVNNAKAIAESKRIVENLLGSQDKDGYIGIYKRNLRYKHKGSNGELWAQTTVFRMLLAYYEFTWEERVLKAVEKAMGLTMDYYNKDKKNPFKLENSFGGATHGLMMTDVCETLYRITGNSKYQDYATYLYRAFSTYGINRSFNDVRYPLLMDRDSLFIGHAVHTYEHLRSLLNAYYNTGHKQLKMAYENAMYKLGHCILPSGAGHGNEWISGLKADPADTASEFCTMFELRDFYCSALRKTGETHFADKAEKLTFNAMMGSRNENGTAITYGKSDNCYILNGRTASGEEEEPRFKYSPTHSEPAVCCVPNYTKNYAYYLDQMWMKTEEGMAAVLYGPSKITTRIEDVSITIEQKTRYPFSDEIIFEITPEKPVEFELSFRKPSWATKMHLEPFDTSLGFYKGSYALKRTWLPGDRITLKFENRVKLKEFGNGEFFLERGPLVYALPIPHKEETLKEYGLEGFKDYYCLPREDKHMDMTLPSQIDFGLTDGKNGKTSNNNDPWNGDCFDLVGHINHKGVLRKVKMVPMGKTVLRKVTFKKN